MLKVQCFPDYYGNKEYTACAYIRLFDPLKLLAKKGIIQLSDISSPGVTDADVIYIQRFGIDELTISEVFSYLNYCKQNKKHIIYEIDDNLLDIPTLSVEKKSKVMLLLKNADVVVVSTEPLKKRILHLNSNVYVIPNVLSYDRIGNKTEKKQSKRIKIGYMGTYTHQSDFNMVLLPLMKLLTKYKNCLELELIGGVSDLGLIGTLENVRRIPIEGRDNYSKFWKWVKKDIAWDIGIAPLKKDNFTVCKSDIKFLDYAAMNCCGVFSEHPAYSGTVEHGRNGLLSANSADSWYKNLETLILNEELRKKLTDNAVQDLYQNRLLESNIDYWSSLFV